MTGHDRRFACAADLEQVARRRLPAFMRDYLDKGLGEGQALSANRADLAAVRLVPRYLRDVPAPDITRSLFGETYAAPFAVAPMGLAGLIWPGSEAAIAEGAMRGGVGHVLSAYSNRPMEAMAPITGARGWFQHYPPNDPAIEDDILARARKAGYRVLVVTIDIPGRTRREHDIRSGMSVPPVITLPILLETLTHPRWALRVLGEGGVPDFGNLSPYFPKGASLREAADHIGAIMTGHVTPERLNRIRQNWHGEVLVKGLLDPAEAETCLALGINGVIVSNHGGRQFDAAPSAASLVPAFRRRLGPEALILADGGIRSGLDIMRMIALGADFVLIGRPFLAAAVAMGQRGPAQLVDIFKDEMDTNMRQLGASRLTELPSFLASG